MAKSLYPTTLFHFTKKEEALLSILRSKFFNVSYAREFIEGPGSNRSFAIPMVSFCDIRLSQLSEHTENYGTFGLGLTKEWAEKNNLNPVIYMSKGCTIFSDYNRRMRELHVLYKSERNKLFESKPSRSKGGLSKISAELGSVYNLIRYMKNYQGTLKRANKKDIPNYRFADEREWRFVPHMFTDKVVSIASLKNINIDGGKEKYNKMVEHIKLEFSYDDIKYIIVDDESNVANVVNLLQSEVGVNHRIISRIMCSKQIQDDL